MIIQKTVLVTIHNKTIEYYESLGYNIPKHFNKSVRRMVVKHNTVIEVKIEHLQPFSNINVLMKCDDCNKETLVPYSHIKKSGEFICRKCIYNHHEYKETQRKSHFGIIPSEKTRKKMSKNNGMKGKFGKQHPKFNPNLTNKERQNQHNISGMCIWVKKVKSRDNYTCKKCGYKGKPNDNIMIAHHINNFKNFKEQRLDINNGITLCKDCHRSKLGKGIHNIYGEFTTKKQFNEFVNSLNYPVIVS